MATLVQLEEGLQRAYNAGNMQYARILGAEIVRARQSKVNLIPDTPVNQPVPREPSLLDSVVGAGEAALATTTGAIGGTAGMIAGTAKGLTKQILSGTFGTPAGVRETEAEALRGAQALTYAPRTATGQDYAQNVGEVAAGLIPVAPLGGEMALLAKGGKQAAPVASSTLGAGVDATKGAVRAAAEKIAPADVKRAGAGIGSEGVSMEVLRREKSANLPVPIDLTKGAAGRDAAQLAFEKEAMKGPQGAPLRARIEQNNLQALQNFDSIIDASGALSPDLAATGSGLVKTLSEGYQKAKAKTRAAYAYAENSPEALAPVDPAPIIAHLNSVPSGLKTTALTDHAKQFAIRLGIAQPDEAGKLSPLPTNVKTMEALRKEISQATGFEPVEIRDSAILKKLIDAETEPMAGPLYKRARAEREAQARKYENRAIVARLVNNKRGMDDPQVPVTEVFNRTVLNSSPEEITFLKRVLKTNGKAGNAAWKELEAETIRHIREEATKGMGMDSADNKIVSPAQLHKTVTALDKNGRLDLMLGKQNARVVRDLNDVVRYVNTVPPGTLVNTSGTAGMLMAAIAEAGATGALTGLPVPIMSGLKVAFNGVRDAKTKARIARALGE